MTVYIATMTSFILSVIQMGLRGERLAKNVTKIVPTMMYDVENVCVMLIVVTTNQIMSLNIICNK